MSNTNFFRHVEADLQLRHVPFDRRQLEEFCATMFALAFEEDNWAWWGDTFLEALGTEPGREALRALPAAVLYRAGAN